MKIDIQKIYELSFYINQNVIECGHVKNLCHMQTTMVQIISLGHHFFIFCFTIFFRNKLGLEDEIKIKIKFIQTTFQLN